jgi:hypothetical protein
MTHGNPLDLPCTISGVSFGSLQEGGLISDVKDLDERRKADQIIVEAIKGLP